MKPQANETQTFGVHPFYHEPMRALIEKHQLHCPKLGWGAIDFVVTGSPENLAAFIKEFEPLNREWQDNEAW